MGRGRIVVSLICDNDRTDRRDPVESLVDNNVAERGTRQSDLLNLNGCMGRLITVDPADQGQELRRTFAPGRFASQPQQVINEFNRHITEPAFPLAFKALAAITDHHNRKRKIAETFERAAPTEAQVNIHGRYSMRKAICNFDPGSRGAFEVRPDSEYCDVEIQHLSLEKM